MRKTCKIIPTIRQKHIKNHKKNTPKKHTEKTTTQKQPKVSRRVTKTRPTREGKGGIQDGILLEKKRILQKPNLLRGKGACGKETRRTLRTSTRSAGPRAARGRIFQCFRVPFRHHFGQGSALLAPSWRPGWSFWRPFFMIFHVFWKIDFGIDF